MARSPLRLQLIDVGLTNRLQALSDEMEAELLAAARVAADITQHSIQSVAPIDEGTLHDSITINKTRAGTVLGYNVRVPARKFGFFYPGKVLEFGKQLAPFFLEGVDRASGAAQSVLISGWRAAIRKRK